MPALRSGTVFQIVWLPEPANTEWTFVTKVIVASLFAAYLVLVGGGLPMASAHAAEQVTPTSDSQFVRLLQSCWMRKTSEGFTSACFDTGGRVYFLAYSDSGRDALAGGGRFSVLGGKVHIEGTGDAWPFERSVISCDGFVQPFKTLVLAQCDGAGDLVGRLVGQPPGYSVADSRWQFESSMANCDWCDMVSLDERQ